MTTDIAKYRPDVDGLRAVAVLAVLGFHFFPARMPGGFVGVDVFFVISGFVITALIRRDVQANRFSFPRFLLRRIRRLFPALILVLATALLAGWFLLLPREFRELGRFTWLGAFSGVNFACLQEGGYFQAVGTFRPLLHLWSLGVEAQFYLLWPLVLLGLARQPKRLVLATVLALLVLSFGANLLHLKAFQPQWSFYLPHARFWEFLGGAWLALQENRPAAAAEQKAGRGIWGEARVLVGLGLIGAAVGFLNDSMSFPGYWALLPVLGAVLVISGGPQSRCNHYLLSLSPVVWLGRISYPLYLWHWPVLSFSREMLRHDPPWQLKIGLLVACILLAWLTYQLVERPIRYGSKSHNRGLLVSMVLVAAAGGLVQASHGVAGRYPLAVSSLSLFEFPYRQAYREGLCFIERVDQYERALNFSEQCLDPPAGDGAQEVFVLWGDSHAAHLYPGLAVMARQAGIRVAQYTAATCPPSVDYGAGAGGVAAMCHNVNLATMRRIAALSPTTVLLAANWGLYGGPLSLSATVSQLRQAGVKRIVLVGPVPQWAEALPQALLHVQLRSPGVPLPKRLNEKLNTAIAPLDRAMEKTAHELGVEYFSPYQALCDTQGCLTQTADGVQSLVSWDYGHLTTAGSEYVADRLFDFMGIAGRSAPGRP